MVDQDIGVAQHQGSEDCIYLGRYFPGWSVPGYVVKVPAYVGSKRLSLGAKKFCDERVATFKNTWEFLFNFFVFLF